MSKKDTVAVQIESLYEGMDFQTTINRGRIEMFTPYKQIVEPIFERFKQLAPDQVIVVGGGGKSPKLQVITKIFLNFQTNHAVVADQERLRRERGDDCGQLRGFGIAGLCHPGAHYRQLERGQLYRAAKAAAVVPDWVDGEEGRRAEHVDRKVRPVARLVYV